MGSGHTRSTPDLFSRASACVPSLPPPNSPTPLPANTDAAATASPRRHVLPKDLPATVTQLDGQELDRLRRPYSPNRSDTVRSLPSQLSRPTRRRIVPPGKLNAVRGWRQAIADRPPARGLPVRCAERAGERCIEASAGPRLSAMRAPGKRGGRPTYSPLPLSCDWLKIALIASVTGFPPTMTPGIVAAK
jgi:hypothetical protein